jgi:hypothetical protein
VRHEYATRRRKAWQFIVKALRTDRIRDFTSVVIKVLEGKKRRPIIPARAGSAGLGLRAKYPGD